MKKYLKQTQLQANLCGAMETGDHSKNVATPKSLMSRGNFFYQMFVVLCMSLFIFMSCGKDDANPDTSDDTPPVVNPDTPVSDPEGTVTANISVNTRIDIKNGKSIGWISPDNFWLYNGNGLVSICDMGQMKGLGNIQSIPQTGYNNPQDDNKTVACESEHGYVVKFEGGDLPTPQYVGLYVVEPIVNTSGGIMGAKVKYKYPFEPMPRTSAPYHVGDAYSEGVTGMVYKITDNGMHGMIVSLNEPGPLQWTITKELSNVTGEDENNGMTNLNVVRNYAKENLSFFFPAFGWCADKGAGWYLPAINELKDLSAAIVTYGGIEAFNAQRIKLGGVALTGYLSEGALYYWSSTRSGESAIAMYLHNGLLVYDNEMSSGHVCAVCQF
jgi:hypothetical protein